jgi:NhaP-type Na+/H+ and K+/H+ antiporter
MDIQTFLAIGIVGGALSLGIEWINNQFKLGNLASKGVALFASLIVGTFYYWLSQSSYAESVIGVLVGSTAVWAFLLNNGKKPQGVEILEIEQNTSPTKSFIF